MSSWDEFNKQAKFYTEEADKIITKIILGEPKTNENPVLVEGGLLEQPIPDRSHEWFEEYCAQPPELDVQLELSKK